MWVDNALCFRRSGFLQVSVTVQKNRDFVVLRAVSGSLSLCRMLHDGRRFAMMIARGRLLDYARRCTLKRRQRLAKVVHVVRKAFGVANVAANQPAAWKFPTSVTESRETLQHGKSLTYGEVSVASTDMWLKVVKPAKDDEVVDLGSGTGKATTQVAVTTRCKKSVGIEIVANRHAIAEKAHSKLPPKIAKRIEFINGDFLDEKVAARIRRTTIIYTANKVFEAETNRKIIDLAKTLPSLRAVVCMVEPCPRHTRLCHKVGKACASFHAKFERVLTAPCEVSWCNGSQLTVYKLRAYADHSRTGP